MSLSSAHSALQDAVMYILQCPLVKEKLCTLERLIFPLNYLSGANYDDGIARADIKLLRKAFAQPLGGAEEFTLIMPNHCLLPMEDGDRTGYHHIFIRNKMNTSTNTILCNEIGCYHSRYVHLNSYSYPNVGTNDNDKHPLCTTLTEKDVLSLMKVYQWIDDNVPGYVKDDLVNYLKKQQKEIIRSKKRYAEKIKKQEDDRRKQAERAEKLKSQKQEKKKLTLDGSNIDENENTTSSISNVVPPTSLKEKRKVGDGAYTPPSSAASSTRPSSTSMRKKTMFSGLPSSAAKIMRPWKKEETLESVYKDREKLVKDFHANRSLEKELKEKEDRERPSSGSGTRQWYGSSIDDTVPLYFSVNGGQVGSINLKECGGVILTDDIIKGLEPLPPDIDTEGAAKTRSKRNYVTTTYGVSQVNVPNGVALVGKNRLTELGKAAKVHKLLVDLLGQKKCAFGPYSKMLLTLGALHNTGGSDEGTQMIIAMTIKAICKEIGLEISDEQLGLSSPSMEWIRTGELDTAVNCLIKTLFEIKSDGAKVVSIMFDHGHRANQDHFVITLIWAGYKGKKKRNVPWKREDMTIKTFVPSINSAGHKAAEAGAAVKLVCEQFLGDDVDVRIESATGDSGGGFKIQKAVPELIKLGVLPKDSKEANCILHALQKMIQNPTEKTMGEQGRGQDTPAQLLYAIGKLFSTLRKQGGVELLDKAWDIIREAMKSNPEWKKLGEKVMKEAWENFMNIAANHHEEDGDASDEFKAMADLIYKAPRGMEEPTFSRWQSTIKVAAMVLDNWAQIYFLAIAVKTTYPSSRYLCKVACTVIRLMNMKSAPKTPQDGSSYDDSIEATNEQSSENQALNGQYTQPIKEAESTLYIMLLFHRAFTDYAFNDTWRFFLQNNPHFGTNTFGQGAQFVAVRAAILYKKATELLELDGNGEPRWKTASPRFKQYAKAAMTVPEQAAKDGDVDQKFFLEELPKTFLKVYTENLDKHILKTWWSSDLVHYMLGGDPTLAKVFADMLVHYNEHLPDVVEDEDVPFDEEPMQLPTTPYNYDHINEFCEDGMTTLGRHHVMNDEKADLIKLNVRDTMEMITKDVDWKIVLKDKFVKEHWDQIENLATTKGVVDLFSIGKDGKSDESTWEGLNFALLLEGIWRKISIHPHHQQRCENFVQLAAMIARTSVGEERRTWRAIAISATIRRFNIWALDLMRAKEDHKEKRSKMTRVKDRWRVQYLSQFADELWRDIREANKDPMFSDEKKKQLRESITKKSNKASTAENEALAEGLKQSTAKQLKQLAAEKPGVFKRTSTMGGKVDLSELTKINGKEEHVNAELMARIILSFEPFVTENGEIDEQTMRDQVKFNRKKFFLKLHEANRMQLQGKYNDADEAFTKTKAIEPFSDEVRALLALINGNNDNADGEELIDDDDFV